MSGDRLAPPTLYLWRMVLFLTVTGFLLVILAYPSGRIEAFFFANPGLNGLIVGVLLFGILYALRQTFRLWGLARWVNDDRAETGEILSRLPEALSPLRAFFDDEDEEMRIGASSLPSVLASIEGRLGESREILRYMVGLLVFLGLLGTFWGLLTTVSSIGALIAQLDAGGREAGTLFAELISGLQEPLAGMGTAFSSSLFGLGGSLILGFLDLQLGQAQNRFHNEMEEWLMARAESDKESR